MKLNIEINRSFIRFRRFEELFDLPQVFASRIINQNQLYLYEIEKEGGEEETETKHNVPPEDFVERVRGSRASQQQT